MSIKFEVKRILRDYLNGACVCGVIGQVDACYNELKKYLKVNDIPVVNEPDLGRVLSDGTVSEINDG